MASSTINQNLRKLITKNVDLEYVLPRLEKANIRYGLYAGAHIAVLTNNRFPTDIDFLVYDDDLPKLHGLFPFAKTSDHGNGVFMYIGKNDSIEFMGAADVLKGGNRYPFRLTDEAITRLTSHIIDGLVICFVDPVDSILLKSILQRGTEEGKHDIEDIEAVLKAMDIDIAYLRRRLKESGALDIAAPVFQKFDIYM